MAGYASAYAHLRAGNRREARSRAISTTMGFFGGGLSAKQLAEASPGGSCVNGERKRFLDAPQGMPSLPDVLSFHDDWTAGNTLRHAVVYPLMVAVLPEGSLSGMSTWVEWSPWHISIVGGGR